MAYFNANRKKLEEDGVDVAEWNKASKGLSLPKKAESTTAAYQRMSKLKGK